MSLCSDLEILDVTSLTNQEITNLDVVVSESSVQKLTHMNDFKALLSKETIPVGFLLDTLSNNLPEGWLLADGSAFSPTEYPELFRILGIANVPNLTGLVTEGSSLDSVGNIQGSSSNVLTNDNMVKHSHQYLDTTGIITSLGDNHNSRYESDNRFRPTTAPIDGLRTTEDTGESIPIPNIQPTLIVNKFIKAK